MLTTEKLGLFLPEGGDLISVDPLNRNFERLEEVLEGRAQVARGSYVGGTAAQTPETCRDYYYRAHTRGLGNPNSRAGDLKITLGFEPKLFIMTGVLEKNMDWGKVATGKVVEGETVPVELFPTGVEYQLFDMTASAERRLCPVQFRSRYPWVWLNERNLYEFGWKETCEESRCLVEVSDNGDGTYTVAVRGTDAEYGTVNYADVAGMTYRWTAIG